MQLSPQIQMYIAFNRRWVIFHLCFIIFNVAIIAAINYFNWFSSNQHWPLPGLPAIIWCLGILGNIVALMRRCERICLLRILKQKSEADCKKENAYAKKVFNDLLRKSILRKLSFSLPRVSKANINT